MTTRSTRLAVYQTPDAALHTIYTNPVGIRTILKTVLWANGSGVSRTLSIVVWSGSPSLSVGIASPTLGNFDIGQWSGWVMLNPGDLITVQGNGAQVNVWVSGTQLPVPPGG